MSYGLGQRLGFHGNEVRAVWKGKAHVQLWAGLRTNGVEGLENLYALNVLCRLICILKKKIGHDNG